MKTITVLPSLVLFAAGTLYAQNQPILGEETVKVSEHVWAIMGFPNIGIVVGGNATLVVDTGLGPRNGATAAKVAKRHAPGEPGVPSGTIRIRDKVQQDEMDQHGEEMIALFAGRSEQNKELLANVKLRRPDETFDKEKIL